MTDRSEPAQVGTMPAQIRIIGGSFRGSVPGAAGADICGSVTPENCTTNQLENTVSVSSFFRVQSPSQLGANSDSKAESWTLNPCVRDGFRDGFRDRL